MEKERPKIGLLGCGTMGTSLAEALISTGEADLTVACDILPEAASRMTDQAQVEVTHSEETLLANDKLDGVMIAVPPYLHASATIRAAEQGLDVFVEKPMATSVADCKKMIDAARSNGIKLMVGQVLRYYEPYRSILRWSADRRFGRIRAASIWRITDGRRWAVEGYWRASRAKSGGYLLEIGAHELDMLRCLMGQPSNVYAVALKFLPRRHEMEDYISATIRFRGGGAASYEGGGGTSVSRYGFRLYFEGAMLMSDAAFDPEALRIYDADGQPVDGLHAEMSSEHPVEAELRDWLAALRGEKPIVIPGEEGLATVALAQTAYQSMQTGRPANYASVLSDIER